MMRRGRKQSKSPPRPPEGERMRVTDEGEGRWNWAALDEHNTATSLIGGDGAVCAIDADEMS